MRSRYAVLSAGLLVAAILIVRTGSHPDEFHSSAPPLYPDLGLYHHPIRTTSPRAQRYFDQGLRLVYRFNHNEAIRSFEEAARLG